MRPSASNNNTSILGTPPTHSAQGGGRSRWEGGGGGGAGAKINETKKQPSKNTPPPPSSKETAFHCAVPNGAVDVLLRFHSHSCKRCWCSESLKGRHSKTPGLDWAGPKKGGGANPPALRSSRPTFQLLCIQEKKKFRFAALQSESSLFIFPIVW